MFPVPDHYWKCEDCKHEFSTCQSGMPPGMHIQIKCSQCGSLNVSGGPLKHGGPFHPDSMKHY